MIIARSPLRITLGGGGTDLPTYYRQHGGFVIAAAIDKYVYVTVTRPFVPGIYLKYSKLEKVGTADEVHHPIIREAIRMMGFRTPQVEITTLADIPVCIMTAVPQKAPRGALSVLPKPVPLQSVLDLLSAHR